MTETNHASEAAASSPDHRLQASALPDERGLQDIARNVLGYYPATMQAMAVEILRMRRDCPPTADFEAMRAELAKLRSADSLASSMVFRAKEDRDAWKHKADTLGGDLNRIRSLVPTVSDEQTTFDAVQAELQRLRAMAERNGKAATERADLLARCGRAVGLKIADDVPVTLLGYIPVEVEELVGQLRDEAKRVDDRVQRLAKVVQCHVGDDVYDAAEKKLGELRAQIANAEREYLRVGSPQLDGGVAAAMRDLANEVEGLRSDGFRHACMAFDTFLRRCGLAFDVSKLEGLMPVPWVIEAAKLLKDAWPRTADNVRKALTKEAQTAIAAMCDVAPELAKAGIQVGPRLSHAEAVAQLRGERDRWREKFEGAHRLVDEAARFEGAVVADLAAHGVFATGGLGGVRFAVGKVLAEMARLRKESKREQVAKQQALLDKIARLFPGKGPLLERVKHAAKVDEPQLGLATTKQLLEELQARAEVGGYAGYRTVGGEVPNWLEAMRRTEPKRDVALAPIRGLVDEAVRSHFERRSCKEPKVGPATGQPRTEAPLAADGSGTVVELGEAFRQNLSNAVACLPEGAIDPTTIKIAIRNLHACIAELAKVVERIGAR